jgi:hypothetical protein
MNFILAANVCIKSIDIDEGNLPCFIYRIGK